MANIAHGGDAVTQKSGSSNPRSTLAFDQAWNDRLPWRSSRVAPRGVSMVPRLPHGLDLATVNHNDGIQQGVEARCVVTCPAWMTSGPTAWDSGAGAAGWCGPCHQESALLPGSTQRVEDRFVFVWQSPLTACWGAGVIFRNSASAARASSSRSNSL